MKFLKGLKSKNKIMIGVLLGFILLIIILSVRAKNMKEQKLLDEELNKAMNTSVEPEDNQKSDFDIEQEILTESFGVAPEGFYWGTDGSLIAKSNSEMTAEETAYTYIRSISVLDFSSAEMYSSDTATIPSKYNNYYGADTSESYYNQFLRKIYKESLLSLEIEDIQDTAVFADGKRIITFNVNVLDLTDKSFWDKDSDTIFNNIHMFLSTETDNTKANQYLYDYVLDYYQSDKCSKRSVQVDISLDKVANGGWLISDDMDLNMSCSYEEGVNVVDYIWDSYSTWVDNGGNIE